jgi:hypothetical protein
LVFEVDSLLAIDLGIKTGLACFDRNGRLVWYRSRNFGSRARLKKAIPSVFREAADVRYLVIEGGGDLADPWMSEARRRKADVLQLAAHDWRADLLLPRERRSGDDAKRHADTLARQIIEQSDAKRPTSLRHDVAEAICIGWWGVRRVGWGDGNNG